mgnify:CR=1 FL=1
MAYTNVAAGAAWRATLYTQAPYVVKPEYMDLPGFQLEMLRPDVLHVFHLGVARDLVGSAMRVLAQKNLDFFQGRTLPLRLRDASDRLREYAAQHGYSMSLKNLTSASLGFKARSYPELRAKGFDSFVILRWLTYEVMQNPVRSQGVLCACLYLADSFMSVVANAPRFMSPAEQEHKVVVGGLFVKLYMTLASEAVASRPQKRLWRVRPKFHLLHHLVLEDAPSRTNYNCHATWLDEDFLKTIMCIKKKVHRGAATRATLKRWLLGLPSYFEHAKRGRE